MGAEDEGSIATVQDRPKRPSAPTLLGAESSSRRAQVATGSTTTSIASPIEALAHDEVVRTRNFCYMGFGIILIGLIALPRLPGGYYETRIFVVGLAVVTVGLGYLLYRTRDPATYHGGRVVPIVWFVSAAAVTTAVPYFGAFSPAPMLLLIGIYFVGLGQSRALAIALYAMCALVDAVSSALVITGIADPGIMRADYLPHDVQLIALVLVQVVFAAAFYISRASRSASLAALGELQVAIRAVAQREALLEEAREELRRALGTGRGRFSDQQIGAYHIGALIGRGAMGEVYEAMDTRDDRPVAIKMLALTSLGNADHVQRFLRELRTTSSIASPNVVTVFDIGEEPLPHLVMERLRGRDLSSILREARVLPPSSVVDLMQQVGAGITTAAVAGVIHRDLKPQNVFLAGTTWKILDFGVSRLIDTGDSLTAGQLVGTPSYMAPEQARGDHVDHRTDLYALAAIAYRCLTGHAPFSGGEIVDVLYRVVHTAPRRPSALAPLPRDVDLALAIGLAKRPEERFETAAELAGAVSAALDERLPEAFRARGRVLDAWAR